jgi:hypothetical protein
MNDTVIAYIEQGFDQRPPYLHVGPDQCPRMTAPMGAALTIGQARTVLENMDALMCPACAERLMRAAAAALAAL